MAANKFIVSLFIVVIVVVATQAHYGKTKPKLCKQCLVSPCHASQPNRCGSRERCVPLPCCRKKCVRIPRNPCDRVRCRSGTKCIVRSKKAVCKPSCKTKTCAINEECVIKKKQAVCQPRCTPAGCAAATCLKGTICKFDGCNVKCVKPNPCDINPCACAKCSSGFICVVVKGQANCVASCKTKTCAVNEECVIKNNQAVCQKACRLCLISPCDARQPKQCGPGETCVPIPCTCDKKCIASCKAKKCAVNEECVIKNNQAVCQPRCNLNGCTAALCPKGTICKFDGCNPKCEPIEAPCDPCKYTKCPSDKTCERSTCDKCAAKCVKKACPVCKADPCTPGIHKCKSNEKCIPIPCSCQSTCKPDCPNPPQCLVNPCDPRFSGCKSDQKCVQTPCTCSKTCEACPFPPQCLINPCDPRFHGCKSNQKCVPIPCSCSRICVANPPTPGACKKDGISDGKICTQAFQVFCNKSCSKCCMNNNGCQPSKEFSKRQGECKMKGK